MKLRSTLLHQLAARKADGTLPVPRLVGCKDQTLGCGVRRVSLPDPAVRQRRAAVSVILRPQPSAPEERCEVLFIKRQRNPRDVWSGDIALPGGRQARGESDLETATRETREEVGLNLSGGGFEVLARLDDVKVTQSKGRPLVVAVFVFRQLTPQSPPLELQTSEVAEAWWTDFDGLAVKPVSDLPVDLRRFVPGLRHRSWLWRAAQSCGLDVLLLPSIHLDPPAHLDPCPSPHEFALWGLTLGIMSQLIHVARGKPLDAAAASFRAKSAWWTFVLRRLRGAYLLQRRQPAWTTPVAVVAVAMLVPTCWRFLWQGWGLPLSH